MAIGAARLRWRRAHAVSLEIGGVDGDTPATCGAATVSLTYATSIVDVSQFASADIAGATGSITLSWQCALSAD